MVRDPAIWSTVCPVADDRSFRSRPLISIISATCLGGALRANNDETPAPQKFTLEGVGVLSRGYAQ